MRAHACRPRARLVTPLTGLDSQPQVWLIVKGVEHPEHVDAVALRHLAELHAEGGRVETTGTAVVAKGCRQQARCAAIHIVSS